MITIRRFTICMTLLLITAIGCMFWIYYDRQAEVNHLQTTVNILWNYRLNEPFLKDRIKNLESKNTQLQQDLDNLNIHYAADKKYIEVLESRYLRCEIYANVAEIILKKNGIDFRQVND